MTLSGGKVLDFIRKGSSIPVIIEISNKKYLLKLSSGLSGKYSLLHEWIGNKLAIAAGLPAREPVLIIVGDDTDTAGIDPEVAALVRKSYGANIGFEYYENAADLSNEDLLEIEPGMKRKIFLFDLLMMNIDRTQRNINLLKAGERIISIDYDCSLLINDITGGNVLFNDEKILKALKENPLSSQITGEELSAFLSKISKIEIGMMIEEIHTSFFKDLEKDLLIEKLINRKDQDWRLKEMLENLENVKAETEEERKERIKKNREKFRMKSGRL